MNIKKNRVSHWVKLRSKASQVAWKIHNQWTIRQRKTQNQIIKDNAAMDPRFSNHIRHNFINCGRLCKTEQITFQI